MSSGLGWSESVPLTPPGDDRQMSYRAVVDDYGTELAPVPRTARLWPVEEGCTLELGGFLPEISVRYETYGRLNARRDNAVLVFHALSGSAHLAGTYPKSVWVGLSPYERAFGRQGWWGDLVGSGNLFDTERFYIICANHLASCYGTTGPLALDPRSGRPYGPDFPTVTIRDLARVQARLLDHLGVERATLLGGSLGGMVALEFALLFPERSNRLAMLAAPGRHGPWARAWNRLAREAVRQDPAYHAGRYHAQPTGLGLARAISTLSYRAPHSFELRWGPEPSGGENYVLRQGKKFVNRFDANSYLALSEAMDTHDVGRGRGRLKKALKTLKIPALFIGIDTDILYPSAEIRELARFAHADFAQISSPHGHDAFLIEAQSVAALLAPFLG